MHLNKILDQIKHHPSPTEAIDKLGKALEKHEGSLLEKGSRYLNQNSVLMYTKLLMVLTSMRNMPDTQ